MKNKLHLLTSTLIIAAAFGVVGVSVAQKSAPAAENEQQAESVDLRSNFEKWNLPRRTQGGRGTCSVFAMTGAVEYALGKKNGKSEHLSVEFANWAKNRENRYKSDGGMFSAIWKGIEKHGVCTEKLLPYRDEFDPEIVPPDDAMKNAGEIHDKNPLEMRWIKRWDIANGLNEEQFADIKKTLSGGDPVCVGLRWPSKPKWKNRMLNTPDADGVYDGHSILFVGFKDDKDLAGGGYFIYRNTNRIEFEEKMTYEYAKLYANDAVVITAKP